MSFRHPLVRAAIVHLASPGERRSAHHSLAVALADFPDRRAWHLAEAATEPDEAVARALDEAALSAWRRGAVSGDAARASDEAAVSDRRRGAASAAVVALMRAGELSPHPGDRSRRLVEDAYLATFTGQLEDIPRLLADAGQELDTPTGLVFAATAHLLTNDEGDVDAAYRLLTRALDDNTDTAKSDNWDHYGILYALLLVSLYALRPEPWQLLKTAMARFEPAAVSPFRLCHDAYVAPTRAPDALRKGLADALGTCGHRGRGPHRPPPSSAECAASRRDDGLPHRREVLLGGRTRRSHHKPRGGERHAGRGGLGDVGAPGRHHRGHGLWIPRRGGRAARRP
ncbi:hypothetical protein HEP84_55230 [Streptomyces sp. RLB1-33]